VAVFVNSLCLLHTHADTTGQRRPKRCGSTLEASKGARKPSAGKRAETILSYPYSPKYVEEDFSEVRLALVRYLRAS
jgi:hypothetical protein